MDSYGYESLMKNWKFINIHVHKNPKLKILIESLYKNIE